jgi:hypothetical protein
MTPLAIAYWLAGDGHCRKQDGSIEIATHSFTLAEVETLRSCGRPTRWVRLLRPSNPTRLGQAAAGPVLIGYGPEQVQPNEVGSGRNVQPVGSGRKR